MPFHAIAYLSGGTQKTIANRSEEAMILEVVIPFIQTRSVSAPWAGKQRQYPALEVSIYETNQKWDKKAGALSDLIKKKKNKWTQLEKKATDLLNLKPHKIFYVTPIQGDQYGDQDKQRVFKEYNDRYDQVHNCVKKFGGTAIRIDKEQTLEELVQKIKKEIRQSKFVICDLTDERPSCYFEAGFAEALQKPVIYIASKQSVAKPGTETKIHFDIHRNVLFFTNLAEMAEKLNAVIEKNKQTLFAEEKDPDKEALAI